MGRVLSGTIPVLSVGDDERDRMYQLMEADYLGMDRCTFEKDLREKDCVMILRDEESARIVGFSTLMVIDLPVQGTVVRAVFSGDSIVQSDFRRTLGLAVELGKYLRRVVVSYPSDRVVWLLTSKGCRTYGILPLLFNDFYPRWNAPTPPLYTQMMDAFGARKYPREYDPVGHLVLHRGAAQRLRPGVADVTDRRLRDPHVQFFVQANPGHMNGDDLVCVADAREGNWRPQFRRILGG
jgi:hypothetical protein